jgi:hypothetical protein
MDLLDLCHDDHPKKSSLAAQSANALLYSENGSKGVLFRSPDKLDDPKMWSMRHKQYLNPKKIPLFTLYASSFLHVSMRAANPIFSKGPPKQWAVGFMAGSKIRSNLPEDQQEKEASDILVNMTACYPRDGATISRKVLQTDFGGDCGGPEQGKDLYSCGMIDGNKTICFMDQHCHCTMDQTIFSYGDYMNRIAALKQQKLHGNAAAFHACWYDAVREMELLSEASNSLWRNRMNWGNEPDITYKGWAECPVTANINDLRSLDAIVIQTRGQPLPSFHSVFHASWIY